METRDEGLRAEIREMCRVDQELLHKRWMENGDGQELASQITEVTQKNTARMRQIVASHGWPGKTLVGEDGANAAWLLVQHADEDREFQRRCLELMAAGPEEVSQGNLAYLVDRVCVGEGRPQVYGTQFWTDESGWFGPRPIEDESLVDARRAGVGLGTLAEYKKTMMDIYPQSQPKQGPLAEQSQE